jgi:hypothetical protein
VNTLESQVLLSGAVNDKGGGGEWQVSGSSKSRQQVVETVMHILSTQKVDLYDVKSCWRSFRTDSGM